MSSSIQTRNAVVINEVSVNQLCQEQDDNVSRERPRNLGYYSFYYDDNNESVYCPDKSSLRYLDLQLPNRASINCLQGYNPHKKYGDKKPKSTNLLRWILENETIMRNHEVDFICNNGLLKEIMTIKYNRDDWNVFAIKIRGQIVLTKFNSLEEQESVNARSGPNNKSTYVANNLQRLITKNVDDSQYASGREEDSFFGVFHSKIGSHNVLHSGFLGCVESELELEKPFEEMKFVLVKKFNAPRRSHSQYHSDTWWSLATLAGVDTLIRAKCERDFTVKQIDKLIVDNLIYRHRQMTFIASLNLILDHFKSIVTEENVCYHFHFNANDKKITGYMMNDMDENLVPTWYIDQQLPVES